MIYRVRRGWFGKCVLQELRDTPSYIGDVVDVHIRDIYWEDVSYDKAPRALVSQFCDNVMDTFTDGIRRKR